MTVTITIPAELNAKIAERGAAKGVTLEDTRVKCLSATRKCRC